MLFCQMAMDQPLEKDSQRLGIEDLQVAGQVIRHQVILLQVPVTPAALPVVPSVADWDAKSIKTIGALIPMEVLGMNGIGKVVINVRAPVSLAKYHL